MSHSLYISHSVLMLSLDSLIAAVALSWTVRPRHYAPLALMFGVCDLVASSVAPALDARLPELASLAPWLLLSGILVLPVIVSATRSQNLSAAAYLLPPLFALDNLVSPATSPVLAGLISCAMAATGFLIGAVMLHRVVPPAARPLWSAGVAIFAIALQLAG